MQFLQVANMFNDAIIIVGVVQAARFFDTKLSHCVFCAVPSYPFPQLTGGIYRSLIEMARYEKSRDIW